MVRRTGSRTVRRVDVRSVARLSAAVYLACVVVVVVVGTLLWLIGAAVGLVGSAESFVKSLFGFQSFHFSPLPILLVTVVTGVVLVGLGTLVNVVAAAIYNVVAGAVGGVEVVLSEDDRPVPITPLRGHSDEARRTKV